jgi:hypothetical protein
MLKRENCGEKNIRGKIGKEDFRFHVSVLKSEREVKPKRLNRMLLGLLEAMQFDLERQTLVVKPVSLIAKYGKQTKAHKFKKIP